MPRYWWVNHGGTFQHEISGSYMWSPFREKTARSQFYDNMRLTSPGEIVFSYANSEIGYVGRVLDFAAPAPKPAEFGVAGAVWAQMGWVVPVEWTVLARPVRPMAIWAELQPLLPSKYSPLVPSTGRGSQKAYLAEVSEQVSELILRSAGEKASLAAWPPNTTADEIATKLDASLEGAIQADKSIAETERSAQLLARVGQGQFRSSVMAISPRCCVTGISDPALLNASHIRPWRACETGAQRLDGHNGLMLSPNVDRLFDRGLMSFRDNGAVILSPRLDQPLLSQLGLADLADRNVGPFRDGQKQYLTYHRDIVLVGEARHEVR